MKNRIYSVGCSGPIFGVLQTTENGKITAWRFCALCPWHSSHLSSATDEESKIAAKIFTSEQAEHLFKEYPEFVEQVREEAGEDAFAAMPRGLTC